MAAYAGRKGWRSGCESASLGVVMRSGHLCGEPEMVSELGLNLLLWDACSLCCGRGSWSFDLALCKACDCSLGLYRYRGVGRHACRVLQASLYY